MKKDPVSIGLWAYMGDEGRESNQSSVISDQSHVSSMISHQSAISGLQGLRKSKSGRRIGGQGKGQKWRKKYVFFLLTQN